MAVIEERAGVLDLELEQGTSYDFTLAYADDDGDPVDLSACIGRLQIRPKYGSSTTILSLASDGEDPRITMGADSTISFGITAAETAAMSFQAAVWDFEVEDTDGSVSRLYKGVITLSREVTQ